MSAVLTIFVITCFIKILSAPMSYEYKGSCVHENEMKCLGRVNTDG